MSFAPSGQADPAAVIEICLLKNSGRMEITAWSWVGAAAGRGPGGQAPFKPIGIYVDIN